MRERHFKGLILAGLFAILCATGCAIQPDPELELFCRRALPAIAQPGATLTVLASRTELSGRVIRIDYRARDGNGQERHRHIRCLFSSSPRDATKPELIAAETERGSISPASLYFLKRFWLDTPEAIAATPAAPPKPPLLGLLPNRLTSIMQQGLAALPAISITGLLAMAFAVIYGFVGRIVMSFSEGAGFASALVASATLSVIGLGAAGASLKFVLAASVLAMAATAGLAWLLVQWLDRPPQRITGQAMLVATIVLAVLLIEGLRLLQGTQNSWMPPTQQAAAISVAKSEDFFVTLTPLSLVVMGLALLVTAAFLSGLRTTWIARKGRTMLENPPAAELLGLSHRKTCAAALTIACAMAGFAGLLMSLPYGGIAFTAGQTLGLKALTGAVVGGINSLGGAFAGGLLVASVEIVWASTFSIETREIAIYTLLAAAIIFRPNGLAGIRDDFDARYKGRQ